MWLAKRPLGWVCALLFAVAPLLGEEPSDCSLPTLLVGVADDHGAVPANLTSVNFRVTHRGRPTGSLRAVYTEGPRRVIVLLDMSGSMRGPEAKRYPKWEIARAAARSLIASLPSSSAAELMTFTKSVEIQAPLSVDHRLAEAWLDNDAARQVASVKGPTAMYAAIEAAEKQLQPTQPGDAIYVVTDGGENASRVSGSKVEKSLLSSGVRLFAFLVISSGLKTIQEIDGTSELRVVVADSGGFMQTAWPKTVGPEQASTPGVSAYAWTSQLPSGSGLAFDDFTREQIQLHTNLLSHWISAFYLLSFQMPEGMSKPKHLDVTVIDSQGHARKDLTLAYSHAAPCAIAPTSH